MIHSNNCQTLAVGDNLGVHLGRWQGWALVHTSEDNGQGYHVLIDFTREAPNIHANAGLYGFPTRWSTCTHGEVGEELDERMVSGQWVQHSRRLARQFARPQRDRKLLGRTQKKSRGLETNLV